MDEFDLKRTIAYNVPLVIKAINNKELLDNEWLWIGNQNSEDPTSPIYVIERADKYILFPQKEEDLKCGIKNLVRAIAILSFVPHGIHIFDLHFESKNKW